MDYKDYYKILGVARDADDATLKKAFRKLARQYHPDHNPDDKTAEAKFKELNEAYAVLSDPDKRAHYDRFGKDWERYQQAGNAGGFDWSQYAWQGNPNIRYTYTGNGGGGEDFFGGGQDFSSFFETLFGGRAGMGGMGGQARTMQSRGRDVEQTVQITLGEAYTGTTRTLDREGQRREFKIPKGVKTGSKIRLSGMGGRGSRGHNGDLYVVIEVLPDSRFERDEDDLKTDFDLPLYIALLGGKTNVPTLEGNVSLTIPPNTQNGAKFRLKGKGMPHLKKTDHHGDLYATAKVVLPTNLTAQEEDLFRQLQSLRG